MSKVSKYAIFHQGLSVGEHTYEFVLDDRFFEDYGGEITRGRCDATVTLVKSANLLNMHTVITGSVEVPCDRCLEGFDIPVDFDGALVVKFSSEREGYDVDRHTGFDDEILWLSPDTDAIDLSEYLYESIYLSLPMQRVHPEGECDPDMLARFVQAPDDEADVYDDQEYNEE